ncbi:hypothetical protein [Leeuwenhoekiella sp. NPDC079379]|uniref:hypothetical protein n=1 Tax=Leeuwenhoekiella sp. NPDC079379 TaxID=3364122 RepID=UPI0037CAB67B
MDQEKMFQFMLKEYEMLYSKFEMHYKAVEKTIGLFFLIIGGLISANGFLLKDIKQFSLFSLSEFQTFCCFFIFIIGSIVLLKVIEHRLLIITYVKNLNQNRKWFNNNSKGEIQLYSLFETTYKSPKYYKKFRHFYWEVLGMSILNNIFSALFLINFVQKFGLKSKFAETLNWLFLLCIIGIGTLGFLIYYKLRAKKEEENLGKKILN